MPRRNLGGIVLVVSLAALLAWTGGAAAQPSARNDIDIPLWTGSVGGFFFVADHPFEQAQEVSQELKALAQQIEKDLGVPPPAQQVRLYIFKERDHYERVLLRTIPQMTRRDTHRNGLFLLRDGVPYVFVLRTENLMRTVRHEFTHAMLNTNIANLPIWVDEGLATYYEAPHGWQPKFFASLREQVQSGWKPDLARLERLQRMQDMGMLEYAEAWSWVYLCMQGPEEVRGVLRSYVGSLKQPRSQLRLSAEIGRRLHDPEASWLDQYELTSVAPKSRWRPALFRRP
jgi:hypothetical protein